MHCKNENLASVNMIVSKLYFTRLTVKEHTLDSNYIIYTRGRKSADRGIKSADRYRYKVQKFTYRNNDMISPLTVNQYVMAPKLHTDRFSTAVHMNKSIVHMTFVLTNNKQVIFKNSKGTPLDRYLKSNH